MSLRYTRNQLGVTNSFGGWITAKSRAGNITATGLAIQANATLGGSTGGIVTIEAKGNVDLDEAQIVAKGDADAGGGFGTGGTVGGARVQRDPELGEPPEWGPVHWRRSAYGHRDSSR